MKKYTSRTIEDTAKIAIDWLSGIVAGWLEGRPPRVGLEAEHATVVGLSGHLGAGKTAFVKCVAKELGIKEDVTSPTFVIMKSYNIDPVSVSKRFGRDFPWKKLVHIDAYRLEKGEELKAVDFENIVSDAGNLILVEWPEQVGLEKKYPLIKFVIDDVGGRVIEF
jgi:tRNA threonylcarbamoyl adenosine modification protein YjeE